MEYLSKQKYNEIAAELKHLIEVVYPKVKEDLAETRAQGDLSENAKLPLLLVQCVGCIDAAFSNLLQHLPGHRPLWSIRTRRRGGRDGTR